jgi:hypothetical protein
MLLLTVSLLKFIFDQQKTNIFAISILVQSVHFPDSFELNLNEQLNEVQVPKTIDQAVELINNTKKRDLTDWNLAEHYDPKVLVQVLQKVSYTHPYVDSYYNRRDHSIMLVFSNPHDEVTLSNHEEWNIKLHSNVGFRYILSFNYWSDLQCNTVSCK